MPPTPAPASTQQSTGETDPALLDHDFAKHAAAGAADRLEDGDLALPFEQCHHLPLVMLAHSFRVLQSVLPRHTMSSDNDLSPSATCAPSARDLTLPDAARRCPTPIVWR